MPQIGIRELRQEASKILERVEAGEVFEVTNRGRLVARLVPADFIHRRTLDELYAEGLLRKGTQDFLSIKPLPPAPGVPSSEEILDQLREDTI